MPEYQNTFAHSAARELQRLVRPNSRHYHVSMGLTHVTTTVRKLAGRGKGFAAEFLVDTGAVDSLAPAKALRKAGIKPEGKNVYELADGSPVELEYGFARISLLGQETVTPIIFGPDGSEPILGVLALEGLGISVDPKTRSLKRERARSLKGIPRATIDA
jgi:clan AA aspartic protease